MPSRNPHDLTDDELAASYGNAQGNSLQRNSMEGESLRRQLIMRREEMKWIRITAITAIASFVVMGLCAVISVLIDLNR